MGKFKVHSSNNFTIINNSVFYNKELSWKAKGILAQMLSLPETWDYTEAGLARLSTDGLTSTRSALKELDTTLILWGGIPEDKSDSKHSPNKLLNNRRYKKRWIKTNLKKTV